MEFKSFLTSSNIVEESLKSASMEAENKELDNNDIRCIKCKGNQNVKLANIASLTENGDENQYFLCENCRKASFKVKIFR